MSIIEKIKQKYRKDSPETREIEEQDSLLEPNTEDEIEDQGEIHYKRSQDKPSLLDKLVLRYPQFSFLRKLIPSRKSWVRRMWRRYRIGQILLILIGVVMLAIGSYLFLVAKQTNVSDLQAALKTTSVIYDQNDQEVGSISGQKGTYVELDSISDVMETAVIATEDRSFYENNGINISRFLLAVATMGRFGGGSTITQQLAKNAYLTQEQTVTRKAKEFFLALELTKAYSKDEILTMYLNNAYFGNGVWGVEDASQKYFGISAADLSLEQAATLAGMLKGPEIYNPIYSIESATNRRNTILQVMVDAGKISQEEADQGAEINIANQLNDTYTGKVENYQYASYFDAVIQEASETYGISEDELVNNGYKIYTELDQAYQSGMQDVFNTAAYFPTAADGESAQGASVAMEPGTGAVRGLVGRVQSTMSSYRSFNYATQGERSPGSTIKPLLVYTPAISAGYKLTTSLPNTIIDYDGYAPSNYGGYESETIKMYEALANSYNIPAVYLMNEIGVNKAFSFGDKFGLDMTNVPKELGVALGGSITTNPLELAQAYATFANGGVRPTGHLIRRIENASGKVVAEFKASSTRVMSQSVADKMTSMMLGTFTNGSAVNANAYGYVMAGKTGTVETEFNKDLTSDQWVVGYTPDVVISQWIGYDQTDESHYLTDASSGTASTIFSAVASSILPNTAGTAFTVENAYAVDGQTLEYTVDTSADTSDDRNLNDTLSELQERANQAGNTIGQALDQAGQAAQELWGNVSNWLNQQAN